MTLTSPAQTAAFQVLPLAKDLDENKVTPGVLGFVVFAVMGIAVWMLMKSMHRHMQKVDFEETPARGAGDSAGDGKKPAASPAPSSSATARDGKSSGPGV